MKPKSYLIFIAVLLISISAWQNARACVWSESAESYRIAMFNAEISGMSQYRPFYYSSNILNTYLPDPALLDAGLNCTEWQLQLGKDVLLGDIDVILNKTNPDLFLTLHENNELQAFFEGNTFIKALLKAEKSEMLRYLVYAKQNEFYNFLIDNPWGDIDESAAIERSKLITDILTEGQKEAQTTKNTFLKLRYAYQLVRMYHLTAQYQSCIEVYDTYFGSATPLGIIGWWALQHKALSLDNLGNQQQANYLYSIVFEHCASKKMRCYMAFNNEKSMLDATLNLAKTSEEKAAVYALSAFKSPGKALDLIIKIYSLNKQSPHLAALIMREINKLEDWIITPELTDNSPTAYHSSYPYSFDDTYTEARKTNKINDLAYLQSLVSFLKQLYPQTNGELQSFVAIGLAHLYLIANDVANARIYLDKINTDAPETVLRQKSIDELMVSIYTEDIENQQIQNKIAANLLYLENLATNDNQIYKTLYSIVAKLSNKYRENGNTAIAGLLKMRSERYKGEQKNEEDEYAYDFYFEGDYYWKIAYFDMYADTQNMDKLIELIQKKNKSKFETYLTQQELNSVEAYLDLKGTIAFRNNDLQTAYNTFSQIAPEFWQNTYHFNDNLNEDPFVPKGHNVERTYNYRFNKAAFVKQLIDLQKEAEQNPSKALENYIKLGNAFYNCTYWGNSWMMMYYGWSTYISKYGFMNSMGYSYGNQSKMVNDAWADYFSCQRARSYFQKVYNETTDNEQKAYSCFMLYSCDRMKFLATESLKEWDEPEGTFTSEYVRTMYLDFGNTSTYQHFSCATLDFYVQKLGLN